MIKVLIVGQGGMGKVHAINYQAIDDVEVVGFVGRNQDVANQFQTHLFSSITEAAQQIEFGVVDVCTPTFVHKDHVLEAFEHHKHVICEKPLALNTEDVKRILEKSKEVNKLLFVAHVVQFTQETQFLKETIKNETYGKVLDATFHRLASIPKWVSSWMFERDKAGLIPFDLHIHDLDLIVSLFGKPNDFRVYQTNGLSEFPEHFRFIYEYPNLNVLAEAAWFNVEFPFSATWRVVFETAVMNFNGQEITIYTQDPQPIIKRFSPELILDTGINVGETDMFYRELSHFIDCIKQNKPSPLMNDDQLLDVISILEEVDKLY